MRGLIKITVGTFTLFTVILVVFMFLLEGEIREDLDDSHSQMVVYLDQWMILLNLITLIRDIAINIQLGLYAFIH